ncbi:MAG: hypothetical protein ACREC0_08975 [Methylocella sp.]
MADELAELAEYAGCGRLATLFALASIEAETNPPVSQLTRDRLHRQENDQTPERALVRLKFSKAGQAISGMDAVDEIKKGAKEDNGAVTAPDKIVKMQLAADAASSKK